MLNERSLTKAEEKRKEEIVKDLKSNKHEFKKRYGKDAERVMYGTAIKRAKKQVKEMNENRIKEAVKAALMKKEGVKEERIEYFEPEDYEAMRDLQDASAMMDAIEDLYKKAKALGYGPDVKKLVADLDEELKNPKKADLNKDGELSSYEEKRGEAIEKAIAKKGVKEIKEGMGNEVGDKVYFKNEVGEKYPPFKGYYGIIEDTTPASNYNMMATYQVVVYDENDNEIRTIKTDFTNLTSKAVNEAVNLKQAKLSSAEYQKAKKLKDFKASDWKWNADEDLYTKVNEGIEKRIDEALNKINEELCPAGKAYIKRRQAAGEKSSAYLSGRGVKVCKGQMSGKKKKK